MKLFQINTTINTGSTGRICEEIGKCAIERGFSSYVAFGRLGSTSKSICIKIGTRVDSAIHMLKTRLFDRHGYGSRYATSVLVKKMRTVDPDIVGLHNVHGYYLNIEVLFNYLRQTRKPIVWTFHDCWPFTGHCTYFDSVGCERWKTKCYDCPKKRMYPASIGFDNSSLNYEDKKKLFVGLKSMVIVTPSQWLARNVRQSFLKECRVEVIHNGIDLQIFRPSIGPTSNKFEFSGKKVILGVANIWDKRKGFDDFLGLAKSIDPACVIVLVGLKKHQIKQCPPNVVGIERTENVYELAELYSRAHVFVNPTYQDNFPTTNIEALACGTPVVTYETGGSPEAIDHQTGIVVEKGNLDELCQAVSNILNIDKSIYAPLCRARAVERFNKDDRYNDYINLYTSLLQNS